MDLANFYRLQLIGALVVVGVNAFVGWKLVRAWRMRSAAILTWVPPRPPQYGFTLFLGVVFGALVLLEVLVLRRSFEYWFFDAAMFVYFGYLFPLQARIRRGFYEQGVWADRAFVPYGRIGGLAWRDQPQLTLLLVTGAKRAVHRLAIPQQHYAEARRLLRDRIRDHEIQFAPAGLDLGGHDRRDDV